MANEMIKPLATAKKMEEEIREEMAKQWHEKRHGHALELYTALLQQDGQEREEEFFSQCLVYASGDISQAARMAINFARLRVRNDWPMTFRCTKQIRVLAASNVVWVLPKRDKLNRMVIVFRPGLMNLNEYSAKAYHEVLSFLLEKISVDSVTQKAGTILVVKPTGVSACMIYRLRMEDYRRGLELHKCFPVKCKQIHVLDPHLSVGAALRIMKPLLGKVMRERLRVEGKGTDWATDIIDMEDLPAELGGQWEGMEDYWQQYVETF